MGEWENLLRLTLGAWHSASFTDADSFTGNPDFVNPNGSAEVLGYVSAAQPGYDDDFHLESKYQDFRGGSLAPILGASGKPAFPTIVGGTDSVQSPAIDRGAASDAYANEPAPNGGYINLGNFGDTAQASESPSQYVLVLAPTGGAYGTGGYLNDHHLARVWLQWQRRSFLLVRWRPLHHHRVGSRRYRQLCRAVPAGLTPGGDYVVKVSADNASVSGLSQSFAVSVLITSYYVNAGNNGGEYTTTPGNDAMTGSARRSPKATIQALLAAYKLGGGDTIYVDSGTYTVSSNIDLTAAVSGTNANNVFTIQGPTSGHAPAILDRGNLNPGADVFDILGGSHITLENLTITGANVGIEFGGASAGVVLLNDTVTGNGDIGIEVDLNSGGTATAVTGLIIETSSINDNGLDAPGSPNYGTNQIGIMVNQGNGGVLFLNDQVFGNVNYGALLIDGQYGAGSSTIDGGAYYGQTNAYGGYFDDYSSATSGSGIYDEAGSLIEDVRVFANQSDGIYSTDNPGYTAPPPGTLVGNTVFGNTAAGIEAHTALVQDNLVYGQLSSSSRGHRTS